MNSCKIGEGRNRIRVNPYTKLTTDKQRATGWYSQNEQGGSSRSVLKMTEIVNSGLIMGERGVVQSETEEKKYSLTLVLDE